eukprot:7121183-Lingulodinium_polyedra.AAC.1
MNKDIYGCPSLVADDVAMMKRAPSEATREPDLHRRQGVHVGTSNQGYQPRSARPSAPPPL